MWPEIEITTKENKRELKLAGAAISERIDSNGLDEHIFDLTALNLLNISDTTLKILPAQISNLQNLQTLLLYGNQLEELPKSFELLDKLKVFDVSRNNLSSIPETISQLTSLSTINCSGNQLQSFPALSVCTKLGSLDLSDNKLELFPDICRDSLSNLSDVNLKGNEIKEIPHSIVLLSSLKHLNLVANKLTVLPKGLASISKLKDLHLEDNPIADKRLLKLIQQCRTKQIVDYVRQHGVEPSKDDSSTKNTASKDGKNRKKKSTKSESQPQNIFHVEKHTDETARLVYMDQVRDIRPYILCCIVKNLNLSEQQFKKFLQIQTKLHETVCGKREKSTIATHDLAKLNAKGKMVRYTAYKPNALEILPLGKAKRINAQKLYDNLKAEAEALRKEKKRNVYSGIHKYLYLLEKKELFSCLEDEGGNVISLPPLTNGDLTKISPETTEIFIEVTSATSATDCRLTMEMLLKEMLLAGFGVLPSGNDERPHAAPVDPANIANFLSVQQVKITDLDGNLRTVYPSKSDLQFDESENILVERE